MIISVVLSLEQLALVKLATSLWDQNDIKELIIKTNFRDGCNHNQEYLKEWENVEDQVVSKSASLLLPKNLSDKLPIIINFTGYQIKRWIQRLKKYLQPSTVIQVRCLIFSWTDKGLIDQRKTAKLLITNLTDDVIKRYELACFHCFEDYVLELWNEMPLAIQNKYLLFTNPEMLVNFWTCHINGKTKVMHNFIENYISGHTIPHTMFLYAAANANISAIKFFLLQMSQPDVHGRIFTTCINSVLNHRRCFDKNDYLDEYVEIFCFLFNELNEEKQNSILMKYATQILFCFLPWPCSCIFVDIAKYLYKFLTNSVFHIVLFFIVEYIKCNFKNNKFYSNLLQEFWLSSSKDQKQYVLHECVEGNVLILKNLLELEDTDIISTVLKGATIKQKFEIFENLGNTWHSYVAGSKWNLLKFLIKECISSKKTLLTLKEYYAYLIYEGSFTNRMKWKKFSSIIDSLIREVNNASSSDCPPSKRICL